MSNRQLAFNKALILAPLTDGNAVNERTVHIVEAIRAYNPRLDVKWIPADKRLPGEPQFAVVERVHGKEYIIFHVQDESQFDGRILEQIIKADTSRNDVLTDVDAHNEALKLMHKKAQQEQMAEATDIAKHVIASPLNKYRVNKDTVIRDYGNRLR